MYLRQCIYLNETFENSREAFLRQHSLWNPTGIARNSQVMKSTFSNIFKFVNTGLHDAAGHRRERTFMEKGVSAEFPGIQLNPPHVRSRIVCLACDKSRTWQVPTNQKNKEKMGKYQQRSRKIFRSTEV